MSKKRRITLVQIMAILALFGILFGVIGTAFLSNLPQDSMTPAPQIIMSGEVQP